MNRRGFTLVELLIVIGIIMVLIAVLLPALRKSRLAAEQVACASNLHQMGLALLTYVDDNKEHFPMIVEPLWQTTGALNFNADPIGGADSQSMAAFMQRQVKSIKSLICPSAVLGYRTSDARMTYRVAAANNYDGQIRTEDQLSNPIQYAYSLKYLNGRLYRMRYVDPNFFPFQIVRGIGPYYLARDFVARDNAGNFHGPHRGSFNQLKLDYSVSFEKEDNVGLTYP